MRAHRSRVVLTLLLVGILVFLVCPVSGAATVAKEKQYVLDYLSKPHVFDKFAQIS